MKDIEKATTKTLEAWNLVGANNDLAKKKLDEMMDIVRKIAVDAVKKAMKDCCTEDNPCTIHKQYLEKAKE